VWGWACWWCGVEDEAMSANNWAQCPKCEKKFNESVKMAKANLKNSYGKVEAEAYILASQAVAAMKFDDRQTLREDWELGIIDGEFYVRYSAHCDKCGFNHEFKKDEVLKI
jgi:predicted Zn-ribbon and HTH transcriptional regulator